MKRTAFRAAGLSVLAGLVFAVVGPAQAEEEELSVQLYRKNVKSTVVIHAVVTKKIDGKIYQGGSRGSGSLIDAKKRLVLTNWHVVDELQRVWVDFPIFVKKGKEEELLKDVSKYQERALKSQSIPAKVLHRDKSRDLAVIQLDRLPSAATVAMPLARSSAKVGETTWNIGSPTTGPGSAPLLFSITEGKVRAVGPGAFVVGALGEDAFEVRGKVLTSTNPTNPGDSGGPLFDKRGYQVAVTQSGITGGGVQAVNTFIDVMEVRAFLKEKNIEIEELTPPEGDTEVAAEPKKGTDPAPKKEPPGGGPATPEDEKAAATALRIAKGIGESEDQKSLYMRKLDDIIKKYPTTAAAKEAKKLLSQVK